MYTLFDGTLAIMCVQLFCHAKADYYSSALYQFQPGGRLELRAALSWWSKVGESLARKVSI